jgi:hypothetical protein
MANEAKHAGKKTAKKQAAKGLTPEELDTYLDGVIDKHVYDKPPKEVAEWATVLASQTAEVIETLFDDEDQRPEGWNEACKSLANSAQIKMLISALVKLGVICDKAQECLEEAVKEDTGKVEG